MPRFRDDFCVVLGSQKEWFARWMGGPTLSKVEGAVCEDGSRRTAFVSGDPDTWFSVPGYVHRKSRRVKGFLTKGNGAEWEFVANKY